MIERGAVPRHRRGAVAEFRGDVGLDRDAGDLFEPVFGDHAGVMRGAAGQGRDPADVAEGERQFRQVDAAAHRVDQRVQRVADHRRLLEDLLLHEMAVIALADQGARQRGLAHRACDLLVVAVEDRHLARGHDGPVAFFEIGDAAGQRRQRQRIRADEHLAVAIADRQRAAAAGADQAGRARRRTGRRGRRRLRAAPACAPPPAPATGPAPDDASPGSPPPRCRSGCGTGSRARRARASAPGSSR